MQLRILPPGECFVQRLSTTAWDFAVWMQEHGRPVRPSTRTSRYAMVEIPFTDAASRQWRSLKDGRPEDAGRSGDASS
jgi:hypothetical protein